MGQPEQLPDIPPAEDLRQGVRTGDEEQRGLRPHPVQVPQRVDGVGGSTPVDVNPTNRELRIARSSQKGHQVPVLSRGHVPVRLLPRAPAGDEDHLVQVEQSRNLAGGDQMSVVYRIKGPAHHPEPHGRTVTGSRRDFDVSPELSHPSRRQSRSRSQLRSRGAAVHPTGQPSATTAVG